MSPQAVLDHSLVVPDEATASQAAEAVTELERFLRRKPEMGAASVSVTASDCDACVEIPGHALRLLVDLLERIACGHAVTVASIHAELTTQQAADHLNVSRPYLLRLLAQGDIPYREVGTRRRVLLVDLLEYDRQDVAKRNAIADELTVEAQRLGLY